MKRKKCSNSSPLGVRGEYNSSPLGVRGEYNSPPLGVRGVDKYAIIVAGGSGSRMKSEIPKQFLLLAGKPILLHTVEKFLQIPAIQLVIVLPKNDIEYWHEITKSNAVIQNNVAALVVTVGGDTRFQSVKNGLSEVKTDGIDSEERRVGKEC